MSKSSVRARPTRSAGVSTSAPSFLVIAPGESVLLESSEGRALQVSVRDDGTFKLWDPACEVEYRAVDERRVARAARA